MSTLKFVSSSALVFAVVFLLLANAGGSSQLLQLPEEGSLLIMTLVTAAATYLVLMLGNAFGMNLSGYIQPIVAIVSPIVITFIESYLQMIPPALDNVALTVIHLIVLLVGSIGVVVTFVRIKAKDTKALLV